MNAPFDADKAQADANARLSDYISRAAGQHRRAIARDFATTRYEMEKRWVCQVVFDVVLKPWINDAMDHLAVLKTADLVGGSSTFNHNTGAPQ